MKSDPPHVEAHIGQTRDFAAGNIYNLSVPAAVPPATPELDLKACAATLLRRYRETSASFIPLFLRSEHQHTPAIIVAPAVSMWSFLGPLDMPDIPIPRDKPEERPLEKVAEEHAFLVLRGDPGAGKTTACRFLSYLAADAVSQQSGGAAQSPSLPVLVELSRYYAEKGEAAGDALARLVALALREGGALPPSYVPSAADGRRWLADAAEERPLALHFDGLNEVAPGFRRAAEDALRQLLDMLRGGRSRIVITTRRHGFEVMRFGELKIFDLQPLSPAAIERYLQDRLGLSRADVETLYGRRMGPRLQLQSSNPLMLNILCDVLQQGEGPPTSRGELFRIFIDGVLERWETSKSSDFGQREFPVALKVRVLEGLAFRMQTAGRSIPLRESVEQVGAELHLVQESAEAVLDELCTNHLLLIRHSAVEFSHHTLQEFFCAQRLRRFWDQSKEAGLAAFLLDARWWESLGMMGGLLTPIELEKLVRGLGDRPVLIGMVLGNAPPATLTESRFVERAGRRARLGILACVAATQGLLLAVVALCVSTMTAQFVMREIPLLLFRFGVDPLNGLPVSFAWCLLAAIVFAATNLYRATEAWTGRVHDAWMEDLYKRWIEPWFLALQYTNTPAAHKVLDDLRGSYAHRPFVDQRLRQHLNAFALRHLNEDTQDLLASLDIPDRAVYAVSLLSLEYKPELARHLVQRVASRSSVRQEAEVALYLAWLRRHSAAEETLLPLLEGLLADPHQDLGFRRYLGRQLRRDGRSRMRPAKPLWLRAWSLLRWVGDLVTLPFRMVVGGFWFVWLMTAEILDRRLESLVWQGWRLVARVIDLPGLRPGSLTLPYLIRGLVSAEEFSVAERLARRLVRLTPRDPAAHLCLCEALEYASKGAKADTALSEAIELFPGHVRLLEAHSRVLLYQLERYREAAALGSTALRLKRDDPRLLRNLSRSLRASGAGEEAELMARRALDLDPQNPGSWEELSAVLEDTGRAVEAEALLLQASARFPGSNELLELRGELLRSKLDRSDEAAELFRGELRLKRMNFNRLCSLSRSFERARLFEEAEAAARRAFELAPHRSKTWRRLAEVLVKTGKQQEADSLLARAAERFLHNPQLLTARLSVCAKLCRYEEAAAFSLAALQLDPDAPFLLRNASWALACKGKLEQAEELARRALDRAPEHPRNIRRLANVLLDLGRYDEANAVLGSRWETARNSTVLLDSWVIFALVRGDLAAAQEIVDAALLVTSLDPEEVIDWRMYQAEILLRQRRKAEALAILDGLSNPTNAEWLAFLHLTAVTASGAMVDVDPWLLSVACTPSDQVRLKALCGLTPTDLQECCS